MESSITRCQSTAAAFVLLPRTTRQQMIAGPKEMPKPVPAMSAHNAPSGASCLPATWRLYVLVAQLAIRFLKAF